MPLPPWCGQETRRRSLIQNHKQVSSTSEPSASTFDMIRFNYYCPLQTQLAVTLWLLCTYLRRCPHRTYTAIPVHCNYSRTPPPPLHGYLQMFPTFIEQQGRAPRRITFPVTFIVIEKNGEGLSGVSKTVHGCSFGASHETQIESTRLIHWKNQV